TNMILMPVRQDNTKKILSQTFSKRRIGQQNIHARHGVIGETHAAIDHDPLSLMTVERHVRAEETAAAQRHAIDRVRIHVERELHAHPVKTSPDVTIFFVPSCMSSKRAPFPSMPRNTPENDVFGKRTLMLSPRRAA